MDWIISANNYFFLSLRKIHFIYCYQLIFILWSYQRNIIFFYTIVLFLLTNRIWQINNNHEVMKLWELVFGSILKSTNWNILHINTDINLLNFWYLIPFLSLRENSTLINNGIKKRLHFISFLQSSKSHNYSNKIIQKWYHCQILFLQDNKNTLMIYFLAITLLSSVLQCLWQVTVISLMKYSFRFQYSTILNLIYH